MRHFGIHSTQKITQYHITPLSHQRRSAQLHASRANRRACSTPGYGTRRRPEPPQGKHERACRARRVAVPISSHPLPLPFLSHPPLVPRSYIIHEGHCHATREIEDAIPQKDRRLWGASSLPVETQQQGYAVSCENPHLCRLVKFDDVLEKPWAALILPQSEV